MNIREFRLLPDKAGVCFSSRTPAPTILDEGERRRTQLDATRLVLEHRHVDEAERGREDQVRRKGRVVRPHPRYDSGELSEHAGVTVSLPGANTLVKLVRVDRAQNGRVVHGENKDSE